MTRGLGCCCLGESWRIVFVRSYCCCCYYCSCRGYCNHSCCCMVVDFVDVAMNCNSVVVVDLSRIESASSVAESATLERSVEMAWGLVSTEQLSKSHNIQSVGRPPMVQRTTEHSKRL